MKWICNKCAAATQKQPANKNTTCQNCGKGRYRVVKTCACGNEFHPSRYKQDYCSKECGYKYKDWGGKKGKKYPHTQRARVGHCLTCGKEYRAVGDFKGRHQKYCSHICYVKDKPETIPEGRVRKYLESKGIEFIQQHQLGKYSVDFYMPKQNTAIEVDGEYWHSLEKAKETDKRKNKALAELGVRLIRLTEYKTRHLGEMQIYGEKAYTL